MDKSNGRQKYIGFVSNSGWYIFIHRWDVIRYLIDKGYHILIIAPEDRHVAAFNHPNVKYIPFSFSNKSRNIFDAVSLYTRLKRLYKAYQPVCLFHYAIKANTFGNLAAHNAGVPCVSVVIGIGYAFLKTNWLYKIVKQLYRRTLSIPEEVWFMNNEDGAFFIQQKLVAVKKVHILHGEGIDTDYFKPVGWGEERKDGQFVFIITTRLLYSKGIGQVADAIRILKNKGYAIRCLLLGAPDHGHPDSIPKHVIDNWQGEGIFEVIPFTEDVRPWLAQGDCFLLPSYYNEGLPRSLMEAASMRLPIITSKQKGCKEAIIEGVSGLFCNIKDPVDLADQMETILNMPEPERLKMGKAGRLLMQQKFSMERTCKEYLRVLKRLEANG